MDSTGSCLRSKTTFGKYEKLFRRRVLPKSRKARDEVLAKDKETLSTVVDFRDLSVNSEADRANIFQLKTTTEDSTVVFGWKPLPGLCVLPAYLSTERQCELIREALTEWSKAPYNNVTNLRTVQTAADSTTVTGDSIGTSEEQSAIDSDIKESVVECSGIEETVDLWRDSLDANMRQLAESSVDATTAIATHIESHLDLSAFEKLNWCNFGFKYHWTERVYSEEITCSIPQTMVDICSDVCHKLRCCVSSISFPSTAFPIDSSVSMTAPMPVSEDCDSSVVPQTAIVNYFSAGAKRPMGGHRDAAEKVNRPLVSVSLGCEAIFLVADKRSDAPLALFLRSGDCLVMSQNARFALHSVARVSSDMCSTLILDAFDAMIAESTDRSRVENVMIKKFIQENRINFNVRQVFEMP